MSFSWPPLALKRPIAVLVHEHQVCSFSNNPRDSVCPFGMCWLLMVSRCWRNLCLFLCAFSVCGTLSRRFDGVLEHVLRIDRVLRQPMGHLLLVGEAGAGKTVLSRFVSWMNGLAIFQASALVCSSLLP